MNAELLGLAITFIVFGVLMYMGGSSVKGNEEAVKKCKGKLAMWGVVNVVVGSLVLGLCAFKMHQSKEGGYLPPESPQPVPYA